MLEAKNLGVRFDDQWLFRGVDLTLESGQGIALVGPSGCGKSVLLRNLALLRSPSEGSVHWNGAAVRGDDVTRFRSQVTCVSQKIADEESTVENYLKIPFRLSVHSEKAWKQSEAVSMLESFGRDDSFLSKSQRELSGGERQIAALVRVLMLGPTVLLLDEPTSAMDGETSRLTESVVQHWIGQSPERALIWVTHDHAQASRISTSVKEMSSIAEGSE